MTPKDIDLAQKLADAAGAVIRPFFRAKFESETKGDATPVTEVDRAAEAAMRKIIETNCPADGIIGEEYGTHNESSARQWVLDPIDGTISFMAGRPIFGTLIALMQDGFPLLGIIDQPISGERWIGVVGRETLFNGKLAKTTRCRELKEASIATSSPHYFDDHSAQHFMSLASKSSGRVIYGGDCYNYGLVASGHIDVVCEAGLKLHDFAALVPIVDGAGGMMCDWNGEPLHAESDGHVLAIGDQARVDDVLEAIACHH